ncbi:MAG: hypothetical protein K0S81_2340, partial [Rhodospirillales bacterium]|nr:hypothetical protein [Rhodospirillales bacterium]
MPRTSSRPMALPTLRTTLLAMAVPTESRREDGR